MSHTQEQENDEISWGDIFWEYKVRIAVVLLTIVFWTQADTVSTAVIGTVCGTLPALWLAVIVDGVLNGELSSKPDEGSTTEWEFHTIAVPRNTEWQPAVASDLVKTIIQQSDPYIPNFYIHATHQETVFMTANPKAVQVATIVKSFYPQAQVVTHEPKSYTSPFHRQMMIFKRGGDKFYEPFQKASEIKNTDPLVTLTQIMDSLQPGETLDFGMRGISWRRLSQEEIQHELTISLAEAKKHVPKLYRTEGVVESFFEGWQREHHRQTTRKPRFSSSEEARHRAKLSQTLYRYAIALKYDTPDPRRLDEIATAASAPIERLTAPGFAAIEQGRSKTVTVNDKEAVDGANRWFFHNELVEHSPDTGAYYFFLTPEEIAAVWHLPHKGFTANKILWTTDLPEEVIGEQENAIVIGTTETRGNKQPVNIPMKDRDTHLYVTGRTGMGKSTFLTNLISQDIKAGRGVAVIDPHGTLIPDLLNTVIPAERVDDVILLECGDVSYPVPLNPFRVPEGISSSTAFNTLLWVMKKIYAKTWSATQMETVMRNTLRALLTDPEATPLDMQLLLSDSKSRRQWIARIANRDDIPRSVKSYWQTFENEWSPSDQKSAAKPVLNRLQILLGSIELELMTCHPKGLNFPQMIRDKKIVLVNLAGDEIRSEAETLGTIFFANFYMASESVYRATGNTPHPFFLYVDEVQRFITEGLEEMFSEARKYGLSLTLANQYFGQLPQKVMSGIRGNVGTKISFRSGDEDAAKSAKLFEPEVTASDLLKLDRFKIAVSTTYNGQTLPAFIADTNPPPEPTGTDPDTVRQRSRDNLGLLPEDDVKKWIDERYETPDDRDADDKPDDDLGDYE